MKKIIMLFVYSVLMAFNACDNNTDYELSDATPEFLLAASNVKKWELIDPTVEIKVGDKIPVIKPTAPEGLVDNGLGYFYFIFLDNTFFRIFLLIKKSSVHFRALYRPYLCLLPRLLEK